MAYAKLEQSAQNISDIITKIDFVIALTIENDLKQDLIKLINKYQIQRRTILNLKKAWIRIQDKYGGAAEKNAPAKPQ